MMTAHDLQSAISDTFLSLVLAQKAQVKKQREQLAEQSGSQASSSSKVYIKAA
ncbi:MAG: hypothetical protein ACJAW8_000388 [Oleispira sp.]|jgi:hypothetical protein|tara:strand:+ start:1150 stop:1308 length:159 start_codon:yes stop_codon:yes gene_type:complete